jgi:hypothetical protein
MSFRKLMFLMLTVVLPASAVSVASVDPAAAGTTAVVPALWAAACSRRASISQLKSGRTSARPLLGSLIFSMR